MVSVDRSRHVPKIKNKVYYDMNEKNRNKHNSTTTDPVAGNYRVEDTAPTSNTGGVKSTAAAAW